MIRIIFGRNVRDNEESEEEDLMDDNNSVDNETSSEGYSVHV